MKPQTVEKEHVLYRFGVKQGTCFSSSQSCQMDPARFYRSASVVMICVLGTARLTSLGKCSCSTIPLLTFTIPPSVNCFGDTYTFRYTCVQGYVRKAGTSSLIKCEDSGSWQESNLECINPNLSVQPSNSPAKPQIPTESPNATESHSVIRHDATFTTTVRTSTSFSSYEGETSESSLGGRNGMALTSQGIVQNISQCCIFENSTLSPGNNQTSHEKAISVGQKVGISFVVVFMICGIVVIGIFLLYRRKNMTPASTRHELEPMNNPA
ncbi:interleukin-15 receptor subunit alpha isoform X2 [Nothobranchius furzeri]|uniref:Transcript variant X2 n=1 Tax=Nothobranchius furzeri TaxID=105023 RepID=A0A9D2YXS4_NOTFU|nr:transcript variant X2 [Nothobranchius furzeri]